MHKRVLDLLACHYDRPVINNNHRGEYVECMIAVALGEEWELTSLAGWYWGAWDCEHVGSKDKLEIKQSAAKQSWGGESDKPRTAPGRCRNARFDIAPRDGYYLRDGGTWVKDQGRPADVHVFAWHGETDEHADHRDAAQWRFFVVAKRCLPSGQKSIGLGPVAKLAACCGIADLRQTVEEACRRQRSS